MSRVQVGRFPLRALLAIRQRSDLHATLLREALDPHLSAAQRGQRSPGRVLALGANHREAEALAKLPFEEVVLSGILEPSEGVQELCDRHPHLSYELANAEALPYPARSFELVLAKEMLHHLPRPVQGFYEMLRVCRQRAVFIEPWSCGLGRLFELSGLATRFESGQAGNAGGRDNHVFRWRPSLLASLLDSYYLESGARCRARVGWISARLLTGRARAWAPGALAAGALAAGWLASWVPGARGNLAIVNLEPGTDLPADPAPAD